MITIKKWDDGDGFTLLDGGNAFEMFNSEALQARDELLKALPLDRDALTVMVDDAGFRLMTLGEYETSLDTAASDNIRLRAKVKRLKRALKGALK